MKQKLLILCSLIAATFSFSQIKTKLVLNDGSVKTGYTFAMEASDLDKSSADFFKINLYNGKKKKKSSFKAFSKDEIKEMSVFNRKDQPVKLVFVKPTMEEFNQTKKDLGKFNKKLVLNYEDIWTPMIFVKAGKDADLLATFTYEDDFKIAMQGNFYVTDSYTFFVVKKKNEDVAQLLGDINKTSGITVRIGKDKNLEKNAKVIFKDLCPKLVADINNGTFNVKYDPVKVFDYYIANCN